MIPQFIESLRRTLGQTETARIGQDGRYFDIARAVKPVSVSVMTAAAWMWPAKEIAD